MHPLILLYINATFSLEGLPITTVTGGRNGTGKKYRKSLGPKGAE